MKKHFRGGEEMAIIRPYESTYRTQMTTRRPVVSTATKKAVTTTSTTVRNAATSTATKKAATKASIAARNATTSTAARKAATKASTAAKNAATSTAAKKAATRASTTARNTATSTAARKAATTASTIARNANIKAVGGSTQAQKTGGGAAQSVVIDVLKGVGSSIQRNPLKGTNYIFKESAETARKTTTVLNIVDTTFGKVKDGVPSGVSVFRVDGSHDLHGGALTNHFNIIDKIVAQKPNTPDIYKNNKIYKALDHKPITNATYSIAKNYKTIGKMAKVGGRALTALAIAGDAMDIYDSYKADGNKIGENTVVTSAGVAGSWAGGIGGSKLGVMGGAAIGSAICPVLGTLVGGIIGGIVGGVGGSIGGRVAGETAAKFAYDAYR